MTNDLIVTLDSQEDSLEIVGGKGRSLAKLTNARFDVPGGFQVTTPAYRQFVAENDLQSKILELAKPQIVLHRSSCTKRLATQVPGYGRAHMAKFRPLMSPGCPGSPSTKHGPSC